MKKISTRFAVLMAAAAVLPLLAYGAVSILSLRSGAQEAVIQGNLNVAQQAAEQIELYVTSSVKVLKAVSTDLQQTGLERWQQDRILKNFVLEFPEYREVTLLDGDGRPAVSSSLGRPDADVPGSEGVSIEGALMSRFSVDDDLLPTAVVAVRLSSAQGDGWVVGRLSLEELWRMVDRIRVGNEGYASVVTADGVLLAHGDPEAKSQVARGDNLQSQPLVQQLRNAASVEETGWARYTGRRGELLGVGSRLPALGWTVLVEQPAQEAFAIAIRLQNQLFVAIGLALLAMLAVGYFWGRTFIAPIMALTRGTQALAAGRLDERVAVSSQDELGQLAVAFNQMADKLVELQEDIRKKERVAVFGRIAVGLVHDLSHPIMNIGNSCKLIVKMFDDLEYRATFQKTVERELANVQRVLHDLRNIAKPQQIERFPINVNKALSELAESMQGTAANSGLSLVTELTEGPLYIEGDLFALNRVYSNLLINAFEATNPHGRVVIRTMRQQDQAIIEIADTGSGIPREKLETLFDDFASTKRGGLGLGLATSKKTVEQLGGTIEVTSTLGVGTAFTLRFPITKARPAPVAAETTARRAG